MKIYEHISKQKENVSADNKNVKMYVCGPTVYNHVHIGNIRPIITFDVLNRLLLTLGYNVKFIHNITDIDDKIITKASQENKTESEISSYYCDQYMKILDELNIFKNNMIFPKVSENISEMEQYIKKILDNGYAYLSDGDVYFRTSKVLDYGIISNKNIDDLETGEKSIDNNKKENEKDFVLWKKTNIGLNWETSFSKGRPGWHTECACLINKYFKDQADIHGGGVDLKFPHHENENAQNIAINNLPISRIWMHVGHLNVDNQKMAKSLNNFILAKDMLNDFDSNAIRWFFYQTNYTNPINYSVNNIKNAKDNIEYIINTLNIFKSYLIIENQFKYNFDFDKKTFLKELEESFSLPNTVSLINDYLKKGQNLLRQKKYEQLNEIYYNIYYLLVNILGIKIPNIHNQENIDSLLEWNKLKQDKNFIEADIKRNELIEKKLI